ncbi:MAG: T9SS type A sorting domain-containing protein, partial [Bacteroidales bacterium]|nr:T9SS type A sorting domain-containing protein [Bacteroidales bacterium]
INVGKDYMNSTEVGCPSLPIIQRIIAIPIGCTPHLQILTDDIVFHTLSETKGKRLTPVQPSKPKTSATSNHWTINDKVYSAGDVFYKKELVELTPLGIMRGMQLVRLTVSPFEYNPLKNSLRVHTTVSAKITFEVKNETDMLFNMRSTVSPYYSVLSSSVVNAKSYSNIFASMAEQSVPMKYVVVARDSFREALQPFIEWKTQQGFEMIEYYPPYDYNRDSIRSYLARLYNSRTPLNPAPTFLLIVGDVEHIQSFIGRYKIPGGATHATDLYYAEYTGDIYPELLYGRMSVTNVDELANVVRKTIEYEQYNMSDKSNLDKALLVAGRETRAPAPTVTNGQLNYLKSELVEWFGMDTTCFYNPASYDNKDNILSHLSSNPGFVSYSGHCTAAGWMYPNIAKLELDTFSQRGNYSFMVNNCCKSSNYTIGECFAETLLRKPNAGAVGIVGAANETLWDEDYYWSMGAKYPFSLSPEYNESILGAFDRLFHAREESSSDYVVNIAQMVQAGNMSVAESGSPYENYYWEIYNVLGDPSLMPYIGIPDSLRIRITDSVRFGDMVVNIEGESGAYVALYDNSNLAGVAVLDEDGRGTIHLDNPILSSKLLLTATAQYRIPFIDTLEVVSFEGKRVVFSDVFFVDTMGNVLEVFMPNQHVNVFGGLLNVGTETLEGLEVIIRHNGSSSDGVRGLLLPDTLQHGETYYGRLGKVIIDSSAKNFDVYTLELEVKDSVLVLSAKTLSKMVAAPQLEIGVAEFKYTLDGGVVRCLEKDSVYTYEVPIVNKGRYMDGVFEVSLAVDTNAELLSDAVFVDSIFEVGDTITVPFMLKISSVAEGVLAVKIGLKERGMYEKTMFYYPVGNVVETFETGDFTFLEWDTTAVYPWVIETNTANVYEGRYSAKSGTILGRKKSVLTLCVTTLVDDSLSFYVKTSTEANYDILSFWIDGEKVSNWSGRMDWKQYKTMLHKGNHTLMWIYEKDDETNSGDDAAWIDDLTLPLSVFKKPTVPNDDTLLGISTDIVCCDDVQVYPNPTKDFVFFKSLIGGDINVAVYDMRSAKVEEFTFSRDYTLSVKDYKAGAYALQIKTPKGNKILKLLIIK